MELTQEEQVIIEETALATVQGAWEVGNRLQWFTLTGLNPDVSLDDMNAEEREQLFLYARAMGDMSIWVVADIANNEREKLRKLNLNQTEYEERWGAVRKNLAAYFGKSEKTIYNYATTAAAWPIEIRLAGSNVGYKHHEALLGTDDAERQTVLLRAEQEGWTYKRLYGVAHGTITPDGERLIAYKESAETDLEDIVDDVPDEELEDGVLLPMPDEDGDEDAAHTYTLALVEGSTTTILKQSSDDDLRIEVTFDTGVRWAVYADLGLGRLITGRLP